MSNKVAFFQNLTSVRTPMSIESCTIRPAGSFLEETDRSDIFDLASFVTEIQIVESIYREYLQIELEFFLSPDFTEQNEMQRFKLFGDEIISVTFGFYNIDSPELQEGKEPGIPDETRRVDFYITEYPLFSRDITSKVEIVKCKGISRHEYLGKFLRLSRSVKGYTNKIIRDIFKNDLKLKENASESFGDALLPIIDEQDKGQRCSLVLPNFSAIETVRWLTRNSFDNEGYPYYCYHSLFDNRIHIESHKSLVLKPSLPRTFIDTLQFDHENSQDSEIAKQEYNRIISFDTDYGISKFIPACNGAFASQTNFLDIYDKSFIIENFDYSKTTPLKLNSNSVFRDNADTINLFNEKDSNENEQGISIQKSIYRNNISLNSGAFENIKNYHGIADGKLINKRDSYIETMDTFQYYMTVNGDFTLNPGKTINVDITNIYYDIEDDENLAKEENSQNDEYLSGKFLITDVKHVFNLTKSNTYVSMLTIKKDSFL